MKTSEIVKEYYLCKNRMELLGFELKSIKETSSFVKVTKYGHDSNVRTEIEDIYIKRLDKRRDLEIQIALDKVFVEKVDYATWLMKRETDKMDYEAFELKYFKNQKLAYLSTKYECSESGIRKRIKKISITFEELFNLVNRK